MHDFLVSPSSSMGCVMWCVHDNFIVIVVDWKINKYGHLSIFPSLCWACYEVHQDNKEWRELISGKTQLF